MVLLLCRTIKKEVGWGGGGGVQQADHTALKIPFMHLFSGTASVPISTFCVCERFLYSQDRSTYFLQQNMQIDCWKIEIAHRHMNVEIGTVAEQFLF